MTGCFLEMVVEEELEEIELEIEFEGEVVTSGTTSYDIYTGDYVVNPSAHNDIVLPTEERLMEADVTVKKILYAETSNIGGGVTVTIGE